MNKQAWDEGPEGNNSVGEVDVSACWLSGRKMAVDVLKRHPIYRGARVVDFTNLEKVDMATMLQPQGKSNGMPDVGVSEGVDDSVSVEEQRGNGPLGRTTRGDHLPTNEGSGSRSPQGETSRADEIVVTSNEDGLDADCLFESTVGAAAAGSSSVDRYVDVDVDGKEVHKTTVVRMILSPGAMPGSND